MNSYELSTPRAGLGLAAIAMTAITMGTLIVLPAAMAHARAVMTGSDEVAVARALVDQPHISECATGSAEDCMSPGAGRCAGSSTD